MKKILSSIILLVAFSLGMHAQTGTKALMPKLGYQTEFKRFALGVEGRYFVTENVRIAPGVTFLFPKNSMTGFDADINVHYVFPIQEGLSVYPFLGGAMLNNHWSLDGGSRNTTDFGMNVGAGAQYDVMENGYVNIEFKYTFVDGPDPAYFMLGYGIRF
ncbi:MAG: outer membrane beta-barrel protein [Dysgonomonas sp.]|jgi:outer membrane protein X|nr:porin family protein [Prevotella sp.]MDR3056870.1 porin family protein [Prevotella sp.]